MTSSNIYPSTKTFPYVYKCTNRETGKFYIGYRKANKTPSSSDFPRYKTSSNQVKPEFDKFDWYIIAEFFDADAAYEFEQQTIHENWSNPLILNKSCYFGKHKFRCTSNVTKGTKIGPRSNTDNYHNPKSTTHKQNIRASQIGIPCENRKWTEERKIKYSLKTTGSKRGPYNQFTCLHCRKTMGISHYTRHIDIYCSINKTTCL